jgi:hypothetical protein
MSDLQRKWFVTLSSCGGADSGGDANAPPGLGIGSLYTVFVLIAVGIGLAVVYGVCEVRGGGRSRVLDSWMRSVGGGRQAPGFGCLRRVVCWRAVASCGANGGRCQCLGAGASDSA